MGQSNSRTTGWVPFSEPCAAQRFHCLGRMHPLVLTVPATGANLWDDRILRRLFQERRVVVEFQSFRGDTAEHLDTIFNRWLTHERIDPEELTIAPVDGRFESPDRSLTEPPTTGRRADTFLERGWWLSAPSQRSLTRLQIAVPLASGTLHTLAAQLRTTTPLLQVLELGRVAADPPTAATRWHRGAPRRRRRSVPRR